MQLQVSRLMVAELQGSKCSSPGALQLLLSLRGLQEAYLRGRMRPLSGCSWLISSQMLRARQRLSKSAAQGCVADQRSACR